MIMNTNKNEILSTLRYTELVYGRRNKKLSTAYSKQEVEDLVYDSIDNAGENCFEKIGKNFYITNSDKNIRITVNSDTYRVITVDRIK